jgi:hypothetical protein
LYLGVTICGFCTEASATVFHPAPDPIQIATGNPNHPTITNYDWTATAGFTGSWYSDLSHVDVGNQSPANVESTLEGPAWLNKALTFVDGGACDTAGVPCTTGPDNSGTYLGKAANVFGIHFGDNFIALVYAAAIGKFSISGLPYGVSNIYAFCSLDNCSGNTNQTSVVPLPPAAILFGTALVGLAGLGRRRSKRHPR